MENKTNNKLIHPIRELREKHGLTQGEMGIILDQTGNFIAQIEKGFSDIPKQTIIDICENFKLDPGRFKTELAAFKDQQKKYLLDQLK